MGTPRCSRSPPCGRRRGRCGACPVSETSCEPSSLFARLGGVPRFHGCGAGVSVKLDFSVLWQGSKSAILHLGPWTSVVLHPSQRLLPEPWPRTARALYSTARGDPLSGMPVSKQQDAPVEAPLLQLGLLCFVQSRHQGSASLGNSGGRRRVCFM